MTDNTLRTALEEVLTDEQLAAIGRRVLAVVRANLAQGEAPPPSEPVGVVSDLFPSARQAANARGIADDAPLFAAPPPEQAQPTFTAEQVQAHIRAALMSAGVGPRQLEAQPAVPQPSPDFIRRTNEEYAAWCKTYYQPEALDERGMPSLHGLWAWQEQERRKTDAQPAVPALTEAWCHPARQALEWAENALATKSRDVDDWADDMHLIAKMLRAALTRKDSHG